MNRFLHCILLSRRTCRIASLAVVVAFFAGASTQRNVSAGVITFDGVATGFYESLNIDGYIISGGFNIVDDAGNRFLQSDGVSPEITREDVESQFSFFSVDIDTAGSAVFEVFDPTPIPDLNGEFLNGIDDDGDGVIDGEDPDVTYFGVDFDSTPGFETISFPSFSNGNDVYGLVLGRGNQASTLAFDNLHVSPTSGSQVVPEPSSIAALALAFSRW